MKYKIIEKCDECKKAFRDMKLKGKFHCYSKLVCNKCYLEATELDAE